MFDIAGKVFFFTIVSLLFMTYVYKYFILSCFQVWNSALFLPSTFAFAVYVYIVFAAFVYF